MSTLYRILLTAMLAACLSGPLSAQRSEKTNPADVYLRAYLIMEDGLKMLDASNYSGAYYKFKDAQDVFDSIFHSDPAWNPEIVEYRRKKVRQLRETARLAEVERRQKVALETGTVNPSFGKPLNPDVAPAPSTLRPTEAVVQSKVSDLQQRIKEVELKNAELFRQIGMKDQMLVDVKSKLRDAQREQLELMQKFDQTKTRLDTFDAGKNREHASLKKQVAVLEKERDELKSGLEKANALLAEANGKNAELLADVQAAYENIKGLSKERDQLVAEREQMTALLENDGNNSRARSIILENAKLKKGLEELKQQLAKANSDLKESGKLHEADQQMIAGLRLQLDASRQELARIKQENQDYQEQMAALNARLDATERALSESGNPAIPESDALRENALLHEIILKMLKQQAGRERAKQQTVALLQENGQITEDLLKNINQMAAPYQMTPAERALLKAGGSVRELPDGNGIEMAILSPVAPGSDLTTPPDKAALAGSKSLPKDKAASDAELRAYATAAATSFRNQNFVEAEDLYLKILKAEPQDVHSLCNLAVVQLRQNRNDEAVKSLKKAQAYDIDNDFAYYLMGVIHLREGRLADATASINEGLKIRPDNAEGHLSLAFIHLKRREYSKAEQEFKKAIQFDPNCADAHYNLAVLYATADNPKLDLAKTHYRKALAHGAAPDAGLDKLLGR